jgi:hypothetical protein
MTTNRKHEQQAGLGQHQPPKQIEEDHDILRDQLDAVATATTCTALLQDLLPLTKMLQEHFVREEQFNGFYEDLRVRRPSLAPTLDALCGEHRLILEEFDELCSKLKERMDREQTIEEIGEATTRDLARSMDRLSRHEYRESRMIGDVYYTDEGGLG